MPINQLGRRFGAGLDTSASAQGTVPKGSAIMSGLQAGVQMAMAIKKSRNDDKILGMEQAKIDKALAKQAAMNKILADKTTTSEYKQRQLMSINAVDVASQLGKVEEQITSRELIRKQKEADLAKTKADTKEVGESGTRKDSLAEEQIAASQALSNTRKGQEINDKVDAMGKVDPILVPMFLKSNKEARDYYGVSDKGVDQMAAAVRNTKLSKVLAKNRTINTSPTEDHLIMADNVVNSAGLSSASGFGFFGDFADAESEASFKDALAGMGLLIAGKDNTVTLRQAMERALPLVARAMDGEGKFHNNALAPYVSAQTALVQPTIGLDGTKTNPPPQAAIDMGNAIIKEKGELSPEQIENFKGRYNLDPGGVFRQDDENMDLIAAATEASRVNEAVLSGKGDGSTDAPAGIITAARTAATKKAEGLGVSPSDIDLKKDITSREKIIGKLENQRATAKSKIGAKGTTETLSAKKEVRRLDAEIKKQRKLLSDITPTRSKSSPKAESSQPLATQKQVEVSTDRTVTTDTDVATSITKGTVKKELDPTARNKDNFLSHLAFRESTNNFKSDKGGVFFGAFQMGIPAMVDAGLINAKKYKESKGKVVEWLNVDGVNSTKDFRNNPQAQVKAVRVFHKKIEANLKRNITQKQLDAVVGKKYKGVTITLSGIIAASHLVGQGAVRAALRSKDPIAALTELKDGREGDKTRTPAIDYIKQFSGHYN